MIWVPLAIVGLATGVGVVRHHNKKKHKLTPEQEKVYSQALKTLKDPVKLKALADKFAAQGFTHEADMLRKRAGLRALPVETKKARRAAFKKALTSKDPTKVHALADLFHKEGAVGSATRLREYAKGLILPQSSTTPK